VQLSSANIMIGRELVNEGTRICSTTVPRHHLLPSALHTFFELAALDVTLMHVLACRGLTLRGHRTWRRVDASEVSAYKTQLENCGAPEAALSRARRQLEQRGIQ
jgi:hypothetical protein